MTTLDFLNQNSTISLDQTNWDEIIYENEYDCNKDMIKYEYNDFGINGMFSNIDDEYTLNCMSPYNLNCKTYSLRIGELKMDIIDKISIKIKLQNPIDKILLFGFYIRIQTQSGKEIVNLLDTNLLDCSILSHLNDNNIEEYENTITIPLMQFNTLEHGYLYRKLSNKLIRVFFENATSSTQIAIDNASVSIIFSGRKYYDFNSLIESSKEIFYNPIDIEWFFTPYIADGMKIKGFETENVIKFIILKLIKDTSNYDEFISNQPTIEEVSIEYESRIPYIYDMKYMMQIELFGVNIYILPLYPEFTNINNILYYLRNSNNGIELYDDYILKIKTNIANEKYNLYISYVGEWIS
jgi:hypothetical protein